MTNNNSSEFPPVCFDYDMALENMGGDPSFLVELAQVFIKESPERMALLKTAVQQKNSEQIYMIAHKLKGESANFGRPRIEEMAHNISQMGRHNQLEQIEQTFSQLEQEVLLFIADLKHRVLHANH